MSHQKCTILLIRLASYCVRKYVWRINLIDSSANNKCFSRGVQSDTFTWISQEAINCKIHVKVALYLVQFWTVEPLRFLFSHLICFVNLCCILAYFIILWLCNFKRFLPFFHRHLSKCLRCMPNLILSGHNNATVQNTTTIIKSYYKGNHSNYEMTRWVFEVSAILPKTNDI